MTAMADVVFASTVDTSIEVQGGLAATMASFHKLYASHCVDGTNAPGCCSVVVAGKKLLLTSNRDVLTAQEFPNLQQAGTNDCVTRSLSTVSANGHDISCFVKDPGADAGFSGDYAGKVRELIPARTS